MSSNDKVFADIANDLERLVEAVKDETITRIKRRTPVRTGNLQRGWATQDTDYGFDVVNDQPYAVYVEEGTPKQRPQGMVRITFEEADQIVAVAVNKVGLNK